MSRFSIEGERAGQALIDWETRIANLERRPVPIGAGSGGTWENRVRVNDLTAWWRMGESFAFASSVANALVDTSNFDASSPRNLTYREVTASNRPTLQVANANLNPYDDKAVQWHDSADTYFESSIAATLNVTNFGTTADLARTFSVWFKTPASLGLIVGVERGRPILGRWDLSGSGGATNTGWICEIADDWSLRWRIRNSGSSGPTLTGSVLSASTWYHAAGTYDGTTYKLYLNGLLVASAASAILPFATGTFFIGKGIYDSGVSEIDIFFAGGTIDEVAFYKRALSASEVSDLAFGIGYPVAVRTITAAYTVEPADDFVLANGTFTVTLPTAVGIAGREITVKNIGTGTITVGRTGGQNIDGAAADHAMATAKSARTFLSDGAGWQIASAYL